MPRKIIPLILLGLGSVLILGSLYFILREQSVRPKLTVVPAKVNFPAPELTLQDIDGTPRSLSDYRGQVVLVNLWATWCPPCKEEMPALQAFYERYRAEGFAIIAINDGDPTPDVSEFVKDYRLTFPVWLDPTYIATEKAFRAPNLPTSFVIDRGGTIRLTWIGGITLETLEEYVAPLIGEE